MIFPEVPNINQISTKERYCDQVWADFFQELAERLGLVYNTIRITDSDSPYTVINHSVNLVCDTDGGAIVVNYAAGAVNDNVRISNVGTSGNDVTANGNGTEKIRGNASMTVSDGEVKNTVYEETEGWW